VYKLCQLRLDEVAAAGHRFDLAAQLVRASGRRVALAVNSRDLERIGRAWAVFGYASGLALREGLKTLGAALALAGGGR
jgi:hypothetical protein